VQISRVIGPKAAGVENTTGPLSVATLIARALARASVALRAGIWIPQTAPSCWYSNNQG